MRHSGLLTALVVGSTTLALPVAAHADNDFSLHLEPGLVAPLSAPQSTTYGEGVALGAKGLFALTPNWAVGPSLSSFYLPRATDNGENAGVLWQFGGSLRFQGDRRVNTNVPLSPWVDVDVMASHTGDLWRPAFDAAVGIEATLDRNHSFWMGPFVRYTEVLQTSDWQNGVALDRRDPHLLQVGLSFSFDYPTPVREHTTVVEHTSTLWKVVHDHDQVAQADRVVPVDHFDLTEKVYFNHDSSDLRWESRDKLDAIVAKLNAHPHADIQVEGHASLDGQLLHNVALSGDRTAAVEMYLIHHGVNVSRVHGEAKGVDSPAAPNTTQEGRERNRRVEFVVHFTSQDQK